MRKTPEIIVINNHKGKSKEQKNEEKLRYVRFFRESEKVHYMNKSFEEFCNEGIE